MNKILGIGLPRTGTTSLSQALILLGIPNQHHCILYDKKQKKHPTPTHSYVDNSFYQYYRTTLYNTRFTNNLFILTTRNKTDWENSILRFDIPNDMPNVDNYERHIKSLFKHIDKESHLLTINIFEDDNCFKKVAAFIGTDCDQDHFPHVNKEKLSL